MDRNELEQAKEGVRLTQLEIDTKIIRSDIHTLKTNHLAHLESSMSSMDRRLERLDNRVWMILFSIIMLVVSNLIITFFR